MKKKYLIILPLLALLYSCGSSKKITQPKKTTNTNTKKIVVENKPTKHVSVKEKDHVKKLKDEKKHLNEFTLDYIKKYAPLAVEEMHNSKIPASITLAQGILESGNGRSYLASKSNNHFGIKCHTGWKGEKVFYDDDEKGECFRKYKYVESSYKDHSKFLTSRRRYAELFKLRKTNYRGWAKGLKKSGYATDKKYATKLISLIEDYKLFVFDDMPRKKVKKREKNIETVVKLNQANNKKRRTLRKAATDLSNVSREADSIADAIAEQKKLKYKRVVIKEPSKEKPKTSVTVLEPKKEEAEPINSSNRIHIVEKGNTLYSIAKLYNTSVATIIKNNHLTSNALSLGQKLYIDAKNTQKLTSEPIETKEEITETKVEPKNTKTGVTTISTHIVGKGDTLYSIARKYNTSVESIMKINNLTSASISLDQKLRIISRTGEFAKKDVELKNKTAVNGIYTVKSGDTLYSIAKKHNTSVNSIIEKNNLSSNALNVGQKLKID